MKQFKNFEKYLRPMKIFQILRNAKFMIHTASKVQKLVLSIILILMTQKIFSRNSLTIMSSTMTHFSAVSLEIGKVMEVKEVAFLVTLALLALVKVCLIMMTFSMEEEGVSFQVVLSVTVEALLGEEYQNL